MRRNESIEGSLRRQGRRAVGGFTLIEIMLTLAVLAILVTLAVPAFQALILSQRTKTAANDAYYALLYARSEAIKANAQVQVEARGADFSAGWEVKRAGAVLMSQGPLPALSVTGPASTTLTYNADGRLNSVGSVSMIFSAAGHPDVSARCVFIDVGGRPSLLTDGNRDGNCRNG